MESAPPQDPDGCPSCGARRPGLHCPECGERRVDPREFGLLHHAREAFNGLTTFDGRLLGSLRSLVFAPGLLTVDWARGARVRRLRPFQLFLLVNLVTVLLGEWLDLPGMSTTSEAGSHGGWREQMAAQAQRLGLDRSSYGALYHAKASGVARITVGVIVPVLALGSFALRPRLERRAGVHLVLATHAVAFLLLAPDLLFTGLMMRLLFETEQSGTPASLLVVLTAIALFVAWWYLADRRLFASSGLQAAWRSVAALLVTYLGGVVLHQFVVFHLTIRALE